MLKAAHKKPETSMLRKAVLAGLTAVPGYLLFEFVCMWESYIIFKKSPNRGRHLA